MTDGVNGGYSLSDIAALMGNHNDGVFGGGSGIGGILIILFFLIFAGGFGGQLGGSAYATSNEVQRGFDNQNSMANEREILSAVTAGTAQSVAATNQSFHDMLGVFSDKYGELVRDIGGLSMAQTQALANQNECCCSTKMLISETAAQNRYDALMNTNAINANIVAGNQKILDALAQNKIDALQNRINVLELAQATSGTVKYPSSTTYNAGFNPFCNCGGCGCGY